MTWTDSVFVVYVLLILLHSTPIQSITSGPNLAAGSATSTKPTTTTTTKDELKDAEAAKYNHSIGFKNWFHETLQTYDSRLRPFFGVRPLTINLSMVMIGISSLSEAKMEFTVELFFHETWVDDRLQFDSDDFGGLKTLTLPLNAVQWLWLTDTTFLNALRSDGPEPGSVSHLYYLRLSHNGTLQYSRRLSVTAECQMDLTMYPFDSQACYLKLSSYGFTIEDVRYQWTLYRDSIPKNIELADFYVFDHQTKVENKSFIAGTFSSPVLCIVFHRRSGFCFIQLITPATAVVASSWISLWLQNETQFADILSIILSIILLSYQYNQTAKVAYVKAIDIYLIACFIFAFLSLMKLAIIKYMYKSVTKRKQKLRAMSASFVHLPSLIHEDSMMLDTVQTKNAENQSVTVVRSPTVELHDRYWRCMRAFHVASQLILPLAFIGFAIFYFFMYPYLVTNKGVCT